MVTREYWEREDLLGHFPAGGDARRTLERVLDLVGDRAGRGYWQELSGYWAFERGADARRIPIYLKPTHLSIDERLLGLLPDDLRARVRGLEQTYPSIYFEDMVGQRPPAKAPTRSQSAAPAQGPRAAVLLAWEPTAWGWREEDVWNAIAATEGGSQVEVQCPTGVRRIGIEPGDRIFLVSHGAGAEGIVASGTAMGQVVASADEQDDAKSINVVDVALDRILDPDAPLGLSIVKDAAPLVSWDRPGVPLGGSPQAQVERLWAAEPSPGDSITGSAGAGSGQARMLDSERRKKVENAAQDVLMQHYRDLGWAVEDTRHGNPFDAQATKAGETIYLEAKGTTGQGRTVILTRGEVRHSRSHVGRHIIGILSGIRFDEFDEIVPDSGSFRVLYLDPQPEDLDPIAFDWTVPLESSPQGAAPVIAGQSGPHES